MNKLIISILCTGLVTACSMERQAQQAICSDGYESGWHTSVWINDEGPSIVSTNHRSVYHIPEGVSCSIETRNN